MPVPTSPQLDLPSSQSLINFASLGLEIPALLWFRLRYSVAQALSLPRRDSSRRLGEQLNDSLRGNRMSSQRRIAASRANGAKSHGPVTPEGRARSDMAAVTHGLTARRVLLDSESGDNLQALRDLYLAHFQPRNPFEADLVEQLVAARWRLDRVWSMETALLEVEIGRREPEIEKEFRTCGDEIRTALAYRALYDESRAFSGLSRYESRFRRICDKIVKALDAARANRKLYEEPSPTDEHPQSTGDRLTGHIPNPSTCNAEVSANPTSNRPLSPSPATSPESPLVQPTARMMKPPAAKAPTNINANASGSPASIAAASSGWKADLGCRPAATRRSASQPHTKYPTGIRRT